MKKKILLIIFMLLALLIALYFYMYKGHRNIATSTADYTVSVIDLSKEFASNDSLATLKYQDKVLQLSGIITSIETESKSIVIDDKVFAVFDSIVPKEAQNQSSVTIKGRFLGYDELLEEFKIDQVSVVE